MNTLSFGFLKPESGDKGATLFTALEADIQQLNDHTHNGADSAALTATAIVGITQTISLASWVGYGGPTGFYRQQVTLPAGFDFDKVFISFRLTSGHYIFPRVEKVSTTQYYVYTTDNTIDFIACYGG